MPNPKQGVSGVAQGVVTRVMADPVRMFLPARYWSRARDWFVYGLDFNTLAAGANGQELSYQVQADSDFLCMAVTVTAATAAAGTAEQAFLPFLIQIRDSASGANWFDSPQHIMNVLTRVTMGAAGAVATMSLDMPRFVPASGAVTVALTNLDGANARRVWIAFRGAKVYQGVGE